MRDPRQRRQMRGRCRFSFGGERLELGPQLFDVPVGLACHHGMRAIPAVGLLVRRRVDVVAVRNSLDCAHSGLIGVR